MGRVDSIYDDWGSLFIAFLSVLSYDSQGRLTRYDKRLTKNTDNYPVTLGDRVDYSYDVFGKNAFGTRSYVSNNVTFDLVVSASMRYAFNEDKQPVKAVSVSINNFLNVVSISDDGDSCLYTYAQGNVTQIKAFDIRAGKIDGRTENTYEYDTSLNPYYGISIEDFNFDFPEQYSRNTVTKQTYRRFDRNGKLVVTTVYAFTNISDSQGRLIERKQINPSISVGSRYTYENY